MNAALDAVLAVEKPDPAQVRAVVLANSVAKSRRLASRAQERSGRRKAIDATFAKAPLDLEAKRVVDLASSTVVSLLIGTVSIQPKSVPGRCSGHRRGARSVLREPEPRPLRTSHWTRCRSAWSRSFSPAARWSPARRGWPEVRFRTSLLATSLKRSTHSPTGTRRRRIGQDRPSEGRGAVCSPARCRSLSPP